MIPWESLDSTKVHGSSELLTLSQRGSEFSIRIGSAELMNSRIHSSEEALAHLTCDRLANCATSRMLIGGLGMGFTTAAALQRLGAEATVVVAELVPAVVTWNRGPIGHLAGNPLNDKRVEVRVTDVAETLRKEVNGYDAILLDVDNGPRGLTSTHNHWLYTSEGIKTAFRALKPSGILAVWSASSDQEFARRIKRPGFSVEELVARSRGNKGTRNVIWLAKRLVGEAETYLPA